MADQPCGLLEDLLLKKIFVAVKSLSLYEESAMKNKLLILFIALAASVTINTVYSGQSEFINGCITEFVQKQAEFEISMRMHPSAQLRSACSPN